MQGIGHKTAQRMAFYVLGLSDEETRAFTDAITEAHTKIHQCKICCNLAEEELCPICKNPARDKSVVCVVEDPRDVAAIERTHEYNGTYHVLHGAISPMDNIGPDQIRIKELLARLNDGTVEEVTLNTVKVRNWDNTIVTLPPYLLVSDSFQNWEGMRSSGGRRVKRSINIDMTSIRFCTPEMLERYKRIDLLKDYIARTQQRVEEYNRQHDIPSGEDKINGLHQTNIGVFRNYLKLYLRQNERVNQNMMVLVRQLQPTEQGLPMELYFFTDTVDWVPYEGIQADVFDHVLAVIPEFDLRVFQNPSGNDLRTLTGKTDTNH